VLKASRARYPFVTRAFADGGYGGQLVRWAKDKAHIVVEVVKRSPAAKGFEVLRRRWVVERTFAWILKNRRFVRLRATHRRCRNPHHHRCHRNPHPAMDMNSNLLKHALRADPERS
jgi:transposase